MRSKTFLVSVTVLTIVFLAHYLKYVYAYLIFGLEKYRAMDSDIRNLLIGATTVLLCVAAAFVLAGMSVKRGLILLGLKKEIFLPVITALLCALPMFLGGFFLGGFNSFSSTSIMQNAFWAGFNEELVYRAFIAGLLIRLANWPFLFAALVASVFFAFGHLYQAQSFEEALLVFSVTAAASVGFTIFYKMWNWNLWFVIGLHSFMNLSFVMFDLGDSAVLSAGGNIFRGLTILLAIAASVMYQNRVRRQQRKEVLPVIS